MNNFNQPLVTPLPEGYPREGMFYTCRFCFMPIPEGQEYTEYVNWSFFDKGKPTKNYYHSVCAYKKCHGEKPPYTLKPRKDIFRSLERGYTVATILALSAGGLAVLSIILMIMESLK